DSSCSYLEDHLVCGVDYSVDNVDDTELTCICGSGYYEDISSGECISASSSECFNCGGERGTCVYDADSGDESSPLFCECSDGWYGTDCSSICPVSDDLGLCSGSSRGTCDAATHTCVCESGYYGSACNLYCDNLSRCGLHGQCAVGDLSSDSSETTSSETLYCKCDAGWYGSTCSSQYPVETVEYVNDDDETNPTIVDYVCGVNYSTDPSSSYSDYGIYSSDTDTYSCDCSSYGLITDASTSTCIDPATHPEYKDIAGNDTACLTCGTTTDSHGICVLGEGEDSLIATCQCEYGWGNNNNVDVSTTVSCSVDMCGVSEDTYTESNADPSSLCSSHGMCYSYDSSDSNNASSIQYQCACDDGWNGTMCGEEDSKVWITILWICGVIFCLSIIFGVIYVILWSSLRKKNRDDETIENEKMNDDNENLHGELDGNEVSSHNDSASDVSANSQQNTSSSISSSPQIHPSSHTQAVSVVQVRESDSPSYPFEERHGLTRSSSQTKVTILRKVRKHRPIDPKLSEALKKKKKRLQGRFTLKPLDLDLDLEAGK
ncbi:hypothetical protein ADUPG1_009011, partial [Aduncisulcus paluster]